MKKSLQIGFGLGLAFVLTAITLGCQSRAARLGLPPGIRITSGGQPYVSADVSAVRVEDFPKLAGIHGLHTVYFEGASATDENSRGWCDSGSLTLLVWCSPIVPNN